MRLFLVDGGKCQYTKDLMPAIFAIAQMEQEFNPYLDIEYLPYREDEIPGILLVTKTGTIRKNYTFKNKKDIVDLRNLIWYYLQRDHGIKNAHDENDFRQFNPNIVIQGFEAKKRLMKENVCCKIILDTLTSEVMKNNILHEVYRLSPIDKQDKNICKKVRGGECGDNYPPNSATYDRCIDEVDWLCNNSYPVNNAVNAMNQLVKNVRIKLYNELNRSNLKVNKQKFDEIIDAGLFTDLGNRMGNKVANDTNVRASLDKIFTEKDYYLSLIEGFDENNSKLENNNLFTIDRFMGLLLILLILLYVYMLTKKN